MKRNPAILLLATLTLAGWLMSCKSNNPEVKNNSPAVSPDSLVTPDIRTDSLDKVVDYLLEVSAKDFHEHQPPVPVDFRNVQPKLLNEKIVLICGEFLAKDEQNKENWVEFATIKTSQYEQWIGSTTYCQNSKVIAYKISDLSSALKNRFDSLQKSTN